MFLRIVLESFENLLEALEKRNNLLNKYGIILYNDNGLTENLKEFAYILIQASLFSDEGITKKELGEALDISASTVDKRLAKLKNILIEDKSGRATKYLIDLNKLHESDS